MHFILGFRSPAIKSVSNEVQELINASLAENKKALLDQISKLVAGSAKRILSGPAWKLLMTS